MTIEEVRNIVAESPHQTWLMNNLNFQCSNPNIGLNSNIKGLPAIYEFVTMQIDGWNEHGDDVPQLFKTNKSTLIELQRQLLNHLEAAKNIKDVTQLNKQWHNILANYQSQTANNPIYLPNSAETLFLIEIHRKYRQFYNGAYNLIQNQYNVQNFSDRNQFTGAILAEEFLRAKTNIIIDNGKLRETAFSNTKLELDKYIVEIEKYIAELKGNTKTILVSLSEEFKAANKNIENEYNTWFKDVSEEFGKYLSEERKSINDLKETFTQLTRLKEPAEYWDIRAKKLKTEGIIAMVVLIFLILVGAGSLYFLLWKTPEGMLKSFFNDDKASAIRWSIIFVTFISILFLGIRYVSKVMFSSFHLSRDAEERHQLTHVYLALTKETNVDEKDRHLIMQSLFSRADTGLLKEESSPTMPSGIDKIISR